MNGTISLEAARLFVAVAQHLSFVEASRRTGVPTSTVSRRIGELEEALGSRLFQRTSRRVNLTLEGTKLFESVAPLFEELETALDAAADRHEAPSGRLRVTAPVVTGTIHVAPLLVAFARAHPKITVDLDLRNNLVDLVEERFDLAFRSGPVEGADLVARRVWTFPYALGASPGFVREVLGGRTVLSRDEVSELPAVVTQASAVWRFVRKDGTREEVKPNGRFSVNDPRVAVEGAASGLGITCAPAEMLDGRGEKIARLTVKGRSPAPRDVFVVYPSRRLIPSRVRALLDWIFKVGK